MTQLLNIHRFHSDKKNKDYEIIQIVRDMTERERSNGFVGLQVFEEHFLPDALVGVLSDKEIGKEIELLYDVYNGKAELAHIKVK